MLKTKGKVKENKATDIEALAYLYTANLTIPLDSDYAEIYFYLSRKSFEWLGKKNIPDFLKDYEKLDEYKMSLLDDLKRYIWNSQEKAYKEKRIKKNNQQDNDDFKNTQENNIEQLKLF